VCAQSRLQDSAIHKCQQYIDNVPHQDIQPQLRFCEYNLTQNTYRLKIKSTKSRRFDIPTLQPPSQIGEPFSLLFYLPYTDKASSPQASAKVPKFKTKYPLSMRELSFPGAVWLATRLVGHSPCVLVMGPGLRLAPSTSGVVDQRARYIFVQFLILYAICVPCGH
jgi:hypothetical protein